jgi:hypothetical protein
MCLTPSPSPAPRERVETLGRAAAVRRRVRVPRRSQQESPHPAIETPFGGLDSHPLPAQRGEGEERVGDKLIVRMRIQWAAVNSGALAGLAAVGYPSPMFLALLTACVSSEPPPVDDTGDSGDPHDSATDTAACDARFTAEAVPIGFLSEGAYPAVSDLDLDGVEEVITGNTVYDPDGNILRMDASEDDGAVAVANLDADAEGEYVVVRWNTVTAYDTDGTVLWGPLRSDSANIFPVPAIGDLDGDGDPEIVVGGGNELWVLESDGTRVWTARVSDQSGATGPAIFDFDADGISEVVYIDETQLIVLDGVTGAQVMQTDEHTSATMHDYPVIADVDADGHAEIVVAHNGFTSAFSVFGDSAGAWAPARSLWNQHAYSVTNIEDDLGVPVTAVPNFTVDNSYHSALGGVVYALGAEILDICEDECEAGRVSVWARVLNRGDAARDAGIGLDLYCVSGSGDVLLASGVTSTATSAGMTSDAILFEVSATDLTPCDALEVVPVDPVGGANCPEDLAAATVAGAFCP